jgi:hypothetical protein
MHNTTLYNSNYYSGVKIAAASKLKGRDASKLLNMGILNSLVDYLSGGIATSARSRAGRAEGLAESVDIDPGLLIKYPVLSSLVGATAGGLGGVALSSQGHPVLGTLLGLTGGILPTFIRRQQIAALKNKLQEEDVPLSKIEPKSLGSRLVPYTAPTRRGHTDAYEALLTGKAPRNMGMGDFAENVTGTIFPLNVLGDLVSRGHTSSRLGTLRRMEESK